MKEGTRKGVPNIACPNETGQHTAAGSFTPFSGRNTTKRKLILGAWNVRTLMDRESTMRPERRTALVARELARYRIDIAALTETRLAGEGSVAELKGGYTFFWRGKADEDRIYRTGFAIRTNLLRQIPDLPVCISERMIKLRFPLNHNRNITIICAYAPTLTSCDDTKDSFYSLLDSHVKATPINDKLLSWETSTPELAMIT